MTIVSNEPPMKEIDSNIIHTICSQFEAQSHPQGIESCVYKDAIKLRFPKCAV